jgi:plasmid stabilization system protein ParE
MKVRYKATFIKRLEDQVNYIARNNPERAIKFKDDLLKQIRNIPSNPYKHRKSIYFNDNHIRDLLFKGYAIVFRIKSDTIEVFGLVKYHQLPYD